MGKSSLVEKQDFGGWLYGKSDSLAHDRISDNEPMGLRLACE